MKSLLLDKKTRSPALPPSSTHAAVAEGEASLHLHRRPQPKRPKPAGRLVVNRGFKGRGAREKGSLMVLQWLLRVPFFFLTSDFIFFGFVVGAMFMEGLT